ncbi:DNA repair exonuclease SbcCD nuclease subunit [Terribacillus aidingensis]|uniref:DNA repair exonuclease SbcCD nuclease subunit n=1 Tax=Terribacillus aidingensis TaxID=586416 RepID=A0A285NY39_9BACI|nr:DNA repair exonuclease [Terribacillus aidingensis]SNZ14404.1 DNA repair exonuclease SbcCD nuclease subunit [Terribacillus aidingensis]
MLPKLTFIHAADLHLDSKMEGLTAAHPAMKTRLQESTFEALQRLVQYAITLKVDFVLLAGDIFDSNRQSLKALVALREACKQLQAAQITVYMQYGNHDYTGNKPVMRYPDNVHIFQSEHLETFIHSKNNEPAAAIHGFSYTARHVKTRVSKHYKSTGDNMYQIGMLHGGIMTGGPEDVYAPFTIEDLKQADFDYWALGHIHKREILTEQPPIVYPGNIQGRHRKETGEKGCYLVELEGPSSSLTFLPLHAIRFEEVTFSVKEGWALYEAEAKLMEASAGWEEKYGDVVLYVHFHGAANPLVGWLQEDQLEELIDMVNEQLMQLGRLTILAGFTVQIDSEIDEEQLLERNDFTAALYSYSYQAEEVKRSLNELMANRQFRRIQQAFTDEEIQELVGEAKQLLLHTMMEVD